MAISYKNIVITPNISNTADPKIVFSGANTTVNTDITMYTYPISGGSLSFEGSSGQLFSITNSLTGTIFSVNDVSGIPSIEVLDTGNIKLAQYGGNIGIGNSAPTNKLSVNGTSYFGANVAVSGTITSGTWNGTTIGATYGGTGVATYVAGDILYASNTTNLSALADVATGNVIISGGIGVAPSYGKVGLTTHISGTLAVGNGGTGQASALTQYGVVYGSNTTTMATSAAGTSSQVLHGNAAGAPTWGAVSLTADVSGILPVANGGTNIGSYAVGDILYASATGVLSSLADVATGNVIISGGVGVAPSYGKVGLTTHVTGVLPVSNGGTGVATSTGTGSVVLSDGATLTGSVVLPVTATISNATSGSSAIVSEYVFRRTTSGTAIGATIADVFTTPSSLSLEATSVYEIEGQLYFLKTTAGTALWTNLFSSAPTLFEMESKQSAITGFVAATGATYTPLLAYYYAQGATTVAGTATGSLTTAVNHLFKFKATVITNAACNWRLQVTQSAGTLTPLAGSYYRIKKLAASTGTFAA